VSLESQRVVAGKKDYAHAAHTGMCRLQYAALCCAEYLFKKGNVTIDEALLQ
jgi:hypothetical protein